MIRSPGTSKYLATSNVNHDMEQRILYLLGAYPLWSETFIRQDLSLLQELGLPVRPVALFPGDVLPAPDWPVVWCLQEEAPSTGGTAFRAKLRTLVPRGLATRLSLFSHRDLCRQLHVLVQREKIGHIHAEFADLPGLLAAHVSRRLGITYSLGVHARDIHLCKYDPTFLFADASFVTVCNAAARDGLLATFPAVADRIRLIYHGLLLDQWPFRCKGRSPHSPMNLLFAGRFVEKKGLKVLLRALFLCCKTGMPVSLTLLGSGPQERELRSMIREFELEEQVTFEGVVSRASVRRHMEQSDCLVVPSVVDAAGDQDGIPNVVLEAMAVGTPVLGTDAGSLGEVLSDATGWPCHAGNEQDLCRKITEIVRNSQSAEEKCGNARKLIETDFDARGLARQRMALFRQEAKEP